jgi:2-aminoethylphosphonate-pyruvate transaminase
MSTEKVLFTPGPLGTSYTVKSAMLRDLGSRDSEFIDIVQRIRLDLLKLAGVSRERGYESILMQGSGTFGIEAVVSSVIPADGHLLVIINGAYGERISKMATIHRIKQTRLVYEEDTHPSLLDIEKKLILHPDITHIAVIHSETTSGIVNPIEEIGALAKLYQKVFIVDAMSSFGAIPIHVEKENIDFLISSSNKCIEGVPGFSFVIAKREELIRAEKNARTLALDLYAQWKGLEQDGQFRFTPPTHAILAFRRALDELFAEGGIEKRAARYANLHQQLVKGMRAIGFREYLSPEKQGYIITSFHYPNHPNFNFTEFYNRLNEKDCVIYPGKLSKFDCFRIGNIGHIFPEDVVELLRNIKKVLVEMGVGQFSTPLTMRD